MIITKNKFDIKKIRNETPGCQSLIHFNNAGAALSPSIVINAIKQHLDLEASTGGYEAASIVAEKADKLYSSAAQLINCNADEIAFTENATRAWDMAFCSIKFKKGDRILTSVCEYASNYLAFLHMVKKIGVIVDVVRNDIDGQLDVNDLENKINDDVKLIAMTHVPTQGGLINPAIDVGKIANQKNIPYLLDATQSIGHMLINVKTIGCDFLCATGRKYLRGPRGTGFLYIRNKILEQCEPPFIDLHAAKWINDNEYILRPDAKRFETWEQNIAGKIGLATAIEYALDIGLPVIWERVQYLSTMLRKNLAQIPSIELRDMGKNQCGIVSFTSKSHAADDIQKQLSKLRINVSVSLQEYARIDLSGRDIPSLVRASVHYYNTEDEINLFCCTLRGILKP